MCVSPSSSSLFASVSAFAARCCLLYDPQEFFSSGPKKLKGTHTQRKKKHGGWFFQGWRRLLRQWNIVSVYIPSRPTILVPKSNESERQQREQEEEQDRKSHVMKANNRFGVLAIITPRRPVATFRCVRRSRRRVRSYFLMSQFCGINIPLYCFNFFFVRFTHENEKEDISVSGRLPSILTHFVRCCQENRMEPTQTADASLHSNNTVKK